MIVAGCVQGEIFFFNDCKEKKRKFLIPVVTL